MNDPAPLRWARRGVGAALLLVVVVPFWKLLESQTGPVAGEAVLFARYHAAIMIRNGIIALLLGGAAAWFIKPEEWERLVGRAANALATPSSRMFATALAVGAGGLTAGLASYVWGNRPQFIDVMAQMIHARYLAAGLAAGPTDIPIEFWTSANTFMTDAGWISQYPPGHVVLLAIGFRLGGAFWIVNPLLMAATAFFTSLVAERLWPEDRATARTGALLVASSPFLLTIAAAHHNHMTAAAMASVAAYCSLRARDGSWMWAVPAGASVGWIFGTRPLTAVTVGAVVTVGIWLTFLRDRDHLWHFLGLRMAGALAGALPFVLATGAYNAHFFGSPFRFGYLAYLGPGHRFGFHQDPGGNLYDASDALGYTSSDLLALGHFLFRSPVSAVLVVALFLIIARRLSSGTRVITAWALALVIPLALYWHHDIVLGPRLLSDAAPAWCLLAAAAGIGLVRAIPSRRIFFDRLDARTAFGLTLVGSLVTGLALFAPQDLKQYKQRFGNRVQTADMSDPALVFVHDTWTSRIAARLAANGMRADSVAIALAHNSSCRLAKFAEDPPESSADRPRISTAPGQSDGSRPTRIPEGVVIRLAPGEELTPDCLREARSDRFGVVPLMPLLWQGDLPGLDGEGTMYVRDLGPERNQTLLNRFSSRRPYVMAPQAPGAPPLTTSYADGMERLWGDENPN